MKINGDRIWDRARGQWVALTPEERVRAWFLDFLIDHLEIATVRIATEFPLEVSGRKLRADIVITEPGSIKIKALVECKSPTVALDRSVLTQAATYNSVLGARYIIVTNSIQTYAYDTSIGQYIEGLDGIL